MHIFDRDRDANDNTQSELRDIARGSDWHNTLKGMNVYFSLYFVDILQIVLISF